ncbi:MAG: hypothetical protein J6B21_02625 [Oscillospiraceae bacterium]|nr:hypothetical protein [Oscillospiraceae bacterium]
MRKTIINNMQDLSDKDRFAFSVDCTVCGKKWTSTPVAFSKAGETVFSQEKKILYTALYQKEKQHAALKAVDEAQMSLNLCPVCKSLVCDNCFMICDDIDMCVDCAAALQEKGERVGAP